MRRAVILAGVVVTAFALMPMVLPSKGPKAYQGWIEADLRFIGAEGAGRLTQVAVAEGEPVEPGTRLFSLDDESAQALVAARRASLETLAAQYELALSAQKRPEEIEILKASRRQAEAQLSLSRQELTRVKALASTGTATRASLDAAIAAEAANQAALDNVRGQITLAGLSARNEAVRQAKGAMDAAAAELAAAQVALERLSIDTPAAGIVQTLYYHVGEVVPAGRPVVSLLVPEDMRVRFFVSETEIAGIAPGQTVHVTCDGCQPMDARISFVSEQAEYTPPEIYSMEERAKLVYRVDATPNDPRQLRAGIPVDVSLGQMDQQR
ncbi:HlyD family efflux transporter periplasmic adaptor subunit [Ciceribacter sp. L1K22]|uniref:HlyD family secretion protein n=1 Tax=Ciceribacter sp. L1K22 TaxID=2820275 RepID=UPI001ABDC3EB|nr:HlyD family efflux transporter periplasmic adaptor subunit [Ciceribacter sp. L1K22]MBO3762005.1 HlyD family efflux transporter periplasmic adaptor subunit [Ciceribacter sp. L1K22]